MSPCPFPTTITTAPRAPSGLYLWGLTEKRLRTSAYLSLKIHYCPASSGHETDNTNPSALSRNWSYNHQVNGKCWPTFIATWISNLLFSSFLIKNYHRVLSSKQSLREKVIASHKKINLNFSDRIRLIYVLFKCFANGSLKKYITNSSIWGMCCQRAYVTYEWKIRINC